MKLTPRSNAMIYDVLDFIDYATIRTNIKNQRKLQRMVKAHLGVLELQIWQKIKFLKGTDGRE